LQVLLREIFNMQLFLHLLGGFFGLYFRRMALSPHTRVSLRHRRNQILPILSPGFGVKKQRPKTRAASNSDGTDFGTPLFLLKSAR